MAKKRNQDTDASASDLDAQIAALEAELEEQATRGDEDSERLMRASDVAPLAQDPAPVIDREARIRRLEAVAGGFAPLTLDVVRDAIAQLREDIPSVSDDVIMIEISRAFRGVVHADQMAAMIAEALGRTADLPAAVRHFRVLSPKAFMDGGALARLDVGTIVNTTTHDIEALAKIGVKMEPCDPPPIYNL